MGQADEKMVVRKKKLADAKTDALKRERV